MTINGGHLLSHVPLFSAFLPEDLEAVCGVLHKRRYPRGDTIFHQEDPGSTLYVVAEGQVKIVVTSREGKQQTLAILGQGSFFGEMSLLDKEPRSASAIAMETCDLVTLGREQFLEFLKTKPEAALKLLAALCRRLRSADRLVQDVVFLDIPGRLAKTILDMAMEQGRRDASGIVINLRLTQGDIAALVGATRESVNKWLGNYNRMGLLQYKKSRITVFRPEELQRYIA